MTQRHRRSKSSRKSRFDCLARKPGVKVNGRRFKGVTYLRPGHPKGCNECHALFEAGDDGQCKVCGVYAPSEAEVLRRAKAVRDPRKKLVGDDAHEPYSVPWITVR